MQVLEITRMNVVIVNPEAAFRRENFGVLHSGVVVYLDGPFDVLAKRALESKEAFDWFNIDSQSPPEQQLEDTEIEIEVMFN